MENNSTSNNQEIVTGLQKEIIKLQTEVAELKKSEELYRSLYDNSPNMYGSVKPDTGEIIFCNQTLLDKTGYSKEEVLGKHIYQLYHDDCKSEIELATKEFLDTGKVSERELILKKRDGSKLPVRLKVKSLKNELGNILYSISVWQDVTEQKVARQEIEKLAKFPAENPNPVIQVGSDGKVLYSNKSGYKFLQSWLGQNIALNAEGIELVSKAIEQNRVQTFELKQSDFTFSLAFAPVLGKDFVNIYGLDITSLKKAEHDVLNLKKFYEGIIENIQDGIWVTNKDDEIFYVNTGMEKIAGASKENIKGNNVLKDFAPETTNKFNNFYLKAKESLQPIWYEVEVNTLKDRFSWQNGWLIPLIRDGLFNGIICTIRDVTDRKLAEEELSQTYQLLYSAEKIGKSGSWYVNLKSRDCYWSDGEYLLYKVSKDVVPTIELHLQHLHPEDQEEYERVHEGYIASDGSDFEQIYRILDTKGNVKYIQTNYNISRDVNGKAISITGMDKDITEQKQADEALRASEQRFNLAMKATKDGLFDWDIKSDKVYYSPAWKSMLGYEYDELPNDFSTWEKLTNPDDVKRTWEFLNEIIHNKRTKFSIEFQMKHKEGDWVDILARADAVFSEGEAVRLIGTHVDITEMKATENELKKHRENLEDLVQERTKELEVKNEELQRFNQLFVGREFRIKELRDKVKKLEAQIITYTEQL